MGRFFYAAARRTPQVLPCPCSCRPHAPELCGGATCRVPPEVDEQSNSFALGELRPAHEGSCGRHIDAEVGELQPGEASLPWDDAHASVGAHARQQFVHPERLGHVVVGAGVQRFDLDIFFAAQGEEDDGVVELTRGRRELEAGKGWHREVGHDEVGNQS